MNLYSRLQLSISWYHFQLFLPGKPMTCKYRSETGAGANNFNDIEMAERINYKALCEAPFEMGSEYEVNFKMLVYTGEKNKEHPVFKVVRAVSECKVQIGSAGKNYWGIVGLDTATGECQWYNYNDCVSLENWAVLDRMLKKRFGWMEMLDPKLVYETKALAKAMLREGR